MIKWTRHPKHIIDKFTDKPELSAPPPPPPPTPPPPPPPRDSRSEPNPDEPNNISERRTSHGAGMTETFGENQSGWNQYTDRARFLSSPPVTNPVVRLRARRSIVDSPGDNTEGNETRRRTVRGACGHSRQSRQDAENSYPTSLSTRRTDTTRAATRKPSR
ncbi:hypothetical protein D915_003984 [Fasciola hepatica]|uniref:Uncharacterized protein n=1 Tax=Fasciola hepatica TaxID=6192 RepID=A0A4E0S1V8_FASHE|nr:hypothetical protein D915_003984 [Fasciola hepatica]